jgi:hypothetical protein
MYYEEKIIDGVLCFRIRPQDSFKQYSIEFLSEEVIKLRELTYELQEQINFLKHE